MTTGSMRAAEPGVPGRLAEHLVSLAQAPGRHRPAQEAAQRLISNEPALDVVGQFNEGLWDFLVDRVDEPSRTAAVPGGWDDVEALRDAIIEVGERVNRLIGQREEELNALGTGDLIRVVLQSGSAALFDQRLMDRARLTGIRFGSPLADDPDADELREWADPLDEHFNREVVRVRAGVGLPNEDAGGRTHRLPGVSQEELLDAAVGPERLHFVAYCRNGELDETVRTCMDQEEVAGKLPRRPGSYVAAYTTIAEQSTRMASGLTRSTRPLLGDRLDRIVFDVQQGAHFFYRVGARDWLYGVTTFQHMVAAADECMTALASAWPADSARVGQ